MGGVAKPIIQPIAKAVGLAPKPPAAPAAAPQPAAAKPSASAQAASAAEARQTAATVRARRRGGMRLLFSQERMAAQNQSLGQQDQLGG